jgi:hypothetical protein
MKVLVFLEHDIICRHFVMSGALNPLVQQADVRFVFPDDGGKRVKLNPANLLLGAPFEKLAIDAERQQTWRWMLYADQLKFRYGIHEAAIRRFRRRLLGWKAATLLTVAGLPLGAAVFQRIVDRRLALRPPRALAGLLDREQPDVVLHPSVLDSVFLNDLVIECRERAIPLVVAMNSWDNPSTKRAVVGAPDWLLVWGPQTRDHAVRFIRMDSHRVVPFGAAQFDVYRERPRIDREQFCAAHGLDPSRRIILFAGSNAKTDELVALQALDRAICDGRLGNISVVYRPHPWGAGGRDGARLANAKFDHVVIDRTMRAYLDNIAAGGQHMSLPDYRDTHDVLSAIDGVVSPMSTILLEAALHAKPAVAYTPAGVDGSEQLANAIPMLHFADFFKLSEVGRASTIDDLIEMTSQLADLKEGVTRGQHFQRAASHFVSPFDRAWKDRLVDFLRDDVLAHRRGGDGLPRAAE